VEAGVVEELLIVGEAHESVLGAAETRVGEGEAKAVEQWVEAEGGEEGEPGEEEEIRSERAAADYAGFRLGLLVSMVTTLPLTLPSPSRRGRGRD
jgi:hypothetical protein